MIGPHFLMSLDEIIASLHKEDNKVILDILNSAYMLPESPPPCYMGMLMHTGFYFKLSTYPQEQVFELLCTSYDTEFCLQPVNNEGAKIGFGIFLLKGEKYYDKVNKTYLCHGTFNGSENIDEFEDDKSYDAFHKAHNSIKIIKRKKRSLQLGCWMSFH